MLEKTLRVAGCQNGIASLMVESEVAAGQGLAELGSARFLTPRPGFGPASIKHWSRLTSTSPIWSSVVLPFVASRSTMLSRVASRASVVPSKFHGRGFSP
ncbi:UNVERIFIED_CONTAM: hypothetical protein Sindi_2593900 [Sesamum indicum]